MGNKVKTNEVKSNNHRSRLTFLALTLILVFFYSSLLFSATIYIDPTNSASGQNGSQSNPYSSWTQFSLVSGNTYLQKRGTTYTSSTQILINSKSDITIGAYGSGNRPKFAYTGGSSAIQVKSSSNCKVEDFEISGNQNTWALVRFDGTSGAYTQNNTVKNCVLHNAHNSNAGGFGVYGFYNNNLKILETEIHNIALDGMYLHWITNLEVGYCNIYDVNMRYFINTDQNVSSGDGIQLNGIYDGFHLHHTIIDRTSTGNKFNFIINSSSASANNSTGIIEHCTFRSGGNVPCMLYLERGKVTIRYNKFETGSLGIRVTGPGASNNLIHNNLFYNCSQGIYVTTISGQAPTGTKIFNNVFYKVSSSHISTNSSPVEVRNNIHLRGTDSGVAHSGSSQSYWTISNNCYGTSATAGSIGTGTNPVIGDPKFIDPANYNFQLQSSSPCIDKGINLNITPDINGTPIPQNGIPDIGAFEYQGSGSSNLPPVINNQSFSVNENSANGTLVGTVVASDPNQGQTLTYSITAGNTSNAFSINSSTGRITVANSAALDYETKSSFALTVRVADNGTPSMNSQATITINIIDVNEAPVINNQSFSIAQNASNGTLVGTVAATDPDQGQTLTYSIISGNTGSAFTINSSTGRITVANSSALSPQTFNLIVRATDNGSPVLYAQATVSITVTSVNQAPVINNQSFAVNEKSANGTLVGTVIATDPDQGQTLTFSITSGNTNSAFAINSTTGRLTVSNSAALVYSTTPVFNLIVKVTDPYNLSSSATVTVNLNPEPPMTLFFNVTNATPLGNNGAINMTVIGGFGPHTYIWTENQPAGIVELPVSSVYAIGDDGNVPQNVLDKDISTRWSHLGPGSWIELDLGQIKAISSLNIAWYREAYYSFNISVSSDKNSYTQVFTGQSNPSHFPNPGPYTFNQINGRYVRVTVNGSNINDWSSITEIEVMGINPFAFTKDISGLSAGTYFVSVTSSCGSTVSGSAVVGYNPGNTAPAMANKTFTLKENSAAGTLVGTMIATDPDPGQTITYSITGGNTSSAFAINPSNGKITVNNAAAINYEANPVFNLTIKAQDNGSPSLSVTATATINLEDVNEAPVINNQSFSVAQTAANGTLVGTVTATDPDQGQTLTYSIVSGNTGSAFAINSSTGRITVANSSALSPQTFNLIVRATDNGSPVLYAQATVSITVTFVNQAPVINNQSFAVNEMSANGTVVGTVVATDPNPGQAITYAITGGNTSSAFAINSSNGKLTVNNSAALVYSTTPVFNLIVKVTDPYNLSSSATVTVNLNPEPPMTLSFNVTNATPPGNNGAINMTVNGGFGPHTYIWTENQPAGIVELPVSSVYAIGDDGNVPQNVLDKNLNTRWSHLSPGSWIELDLGQVKTITSLNIAWYRDAYYSFSIAISSDRSNYTQVFSGQSNPNHFPNPGPYAFNQINGRYVRVYVNGSNVNNWSSITEIEVMGINPFAFTKDISGLSAGTYFVSVTSSCGSTVSGSAVVGYNPGNTAPAMANKTFTLKENSAAGTLVGTMIATDPDPDQTITYSITGGNTSSAFAINPSNGKITVNNAAAINYEANPVFNLTIKAQDNGSPSLSVTATATINLEDVNEAPVINNQSFSVAQTAANGTLVGTVTATDPDQGQTLTYSIVSGNTGSAFAINSSTGRITVANSSALSPQTFSLIVRATDNGSPVLYAQATVSITVTFVNQAPVINNQSFAVNEMSANGTVVGTVVATDPNPGQAITYSITGGNTSSAFAINSSNGKLTVNNSAALVYSTTPVFNLIVKVTDPYNLSSSATVTVNLNPEPPMTLSFNVTNATPPGNNGAINMTVNGGFGPHTYIWTANQPAGIVELPVSSVYAIGDDGNVPQNVLDKNLNTRWSHLSPGSWIELDLGQIKTISSLNIAWYRQAYYSFSIAISSDKSNYTQVFSGQSNPNHFPNPGPYSFNQINGRYVRVYVNGSNINDWSSITEIEVMGINPFAYTKDISGLSAGTYFVSVTSSCGNTVSGNAEVGYNSGNRAPVIRNHAFSIAQNVSSGTFVGNVIATDPDQGQTLTYSIVSGNTGNAFAINASSGNITVANSNALTPQVFNLTVRATDNGSPVMYAQANVSIEVIGENHAPIFGYQTFNIAMYPATNSLVGTLNAVDPDPGQTLTYSITGGNSYGIFALDPATGDITVLLGNYLYPRTIYMIARATDNGNPSLYSDAIVQVNVHETNHAPQINYQTIYTSTYPPAGTIIGRVNVSDKNENQKHTFEIVSGNSFDIFDINRETGDIIVLNQWVLYERTFHLKIRVTDDGYPNLSAEDMLSIYVTNSPGNITTPKNQQLFHASTDMPEGSSVGKIMSNFSSKSVREEFCHLDHHSETGFAVDRLTGKIIVSDPEKLTPGILKFRTGIFTNEETIELQEIVEVTINVTEKSTNVNTKEDNNMHSTFVATEPVVSPNPSYDGLFNLNMETEQSTPVQIAVFDLSGKLILNSVKIPTDRILINLSDQPKGVYLIKVFDGNKQKTLKAVIG